ncbi:MAG: hypothetical protein WC208_15310 [Gallionella sp.]|jgi:hypothetical protein
MVSEGQAISVVSFKDYDGNYIAPKSANGQMRVIAQDYLLALAEGDIPNHTAWSKIGYNPSVTTSQDDCISATGSYTFPTVGTTMQISSGNAQDAYPSGEGARTINLYYLDSNYAEGSEVLQLSGTTPVNTAGTDIFRVNNMRVASTGTLYSTAGAVSLKAGAVTHGYIRAGFNRQRQLIYTVPANKTLFVSSWSIGAGDMTVGKTMICTTRATYDNKSGAMLTAGKHFMPYTEIALSNMPFLRNFEEPTRLPEKTDLKVSCYTTSGGGVCSSRLNGWIEYN